MRKKFHVLLWGVLGVVTVSAVLLLLVYRAIQHVPEFYHQEIAQDKATQRSDAAVMGTRATTMYSDARQQGDWHALFTAKQINAWLAVELVEKHPHLLPADVTNPRIAVTPELVTLAFRGRHGGFSTVLTLDVGLYVNDADELACQFYRARAGNVRLPLKRVLDEVTRVAWRMKLPLRWAQVDGNPVALLDVSSLMSAKDPVKLKTVELREGEIYIAGATTVAGQNHHKGRE